MVEGTTADRSKVGKGGKVSIREKLADRLVKDIEPILKKYKESLGQRSHGREGKIDFRNFASYDIAYKSIAIFKEMLDTMELPIHKPKYNLQPTPYGWIEGTQDLIKAIKDLLEVKE